MSYEAQLLLYVLSLFFVNTSNYIYGKTTQLPLWAMRVPSGFANSYLVLGGLSQITTVIILIYGFFLFSWWAVLLMFVFSGIFAGYVYFKTGTMLTSLFTLVLFPVGLLLNFFIYMAR